LRESSAAAGQYRHQVFDFIHSILSALNRGAGTDGDAHAVMALNTRRLPRYNVRYAQLSITMIFRPTRDDDRE
jgi:hypothetical protein